MAYYLKQSHLKKGLYLQIYFSARDSVKKQTRSSCFQTLGYVDDLKCQQIPNPVAHYEDVVKRMNQLANEEKEKARLECISDSSPEKYLGYFPLKAILKILNVEPIFKLLQAPLGIRYDLFQAFCALVFSRAIEPASKHKTFEQVIPRLWEDYNFSYDQLLDAVEYFGKQHEKIVSLFTEKTAKYFTINTEKTFFDCTNFYFEIDAEDSLRRKGPSKENRKDPIVGMGLLLDNDCVPIGMKLYPGNESEKPVLRTVIRDLKEQNHITGRTIQVADKGLNCAENIYTALADKDGYIFSKSVKQLPETEITWVLLTDGYKEVRSAEGHLLYKYKSCIDTFEYKLSRNGKASKFHTKEKRVATFNPKLCKKQKHEIMKQVEKAERNMRMKAKKDEYGESAKYVKFQSVGKDGEETGQKPKVVLNTEKIEKDLALCGYNLLVSSELNMEPEEIYNVYHRLWRIEESFRTMKSQLDSRPVYLQKTDSIKGHFLICYITVLLERLFQFKILGEKYSSEAVYDLFRHFRVVKVPNENYINISTNSRLIEYLATNYKLPIKYLRLTDKQIKKVLNVKFNV